MILSISGSGVWLGSSFEVIPRNPNAAVFNESAPVFTRRSTAAHVTIFVTLATRKSVSGCVVG